MTELFLGLTDGFFLAGFGGIGEGTILGLRGTRRKSRDRPNHENNQRQHRLPAELVEPLGEDFPATPPLPAPRFSTDSSDGSDQDFFTFRLLQLASVQAVRMMTLTPECFWLY